MWWQARGPRPSVAAGRQRDSQAGQTPQSRKESIAGTGFSPPRLNPRTRQPRWVKGAYGIGYAANP